MKMRVRGTGYRVCDAPLYEHGNARGVWASHVPTDEVRHRQWGGIVEATCQKRNRYRKRKRKRKLTGERNQHSGNRKILTKFDTIEISCRFLTLPGCKYPASSHPLEIF